MKSQGMSKAEIEETNKMMQQGKEMAKQSGFTGKMQGSNSIPELSPRQTKVLNSMPRLISKDQHNTFLQTMLQTLTAKADKKDIAAASAVFEKYKADPETLCNLPAFYLYKKDLPAALYSAIRAAQLNPDALLIQNNLAATLLQTGYPHKAIPLLRYLLRERSPSPLLNNIAQSYLSLGEIDSARKYFGLCLQKAPDHSEANCGMGYLETMKGDPIKAAPYLSAAIKNGFSPLAVALLKKNKTKVTLKDVDNQNYKVPKYFNPYVHKPIDPATSLDDRDSIFQERNNQFDMINDWTNSYYKLNQTLKPKSQKEETTILVANASRFLGNSILAEKAQFILPLIQEELYKIEKERAGVYAKALQKNMELGSALNAMSGSPDCPAEAALVNEYLKTTAADYKGYVNHYKKDIYDYHDKLLYCSFFLYDDRTYSQAFMAGVQSFYGALQKMNELQPLHYAISRCNPKNMNSRHDTLDMEAWCPFTFTIPFGIGKMKLDCKVFEFEAGEGLVGSYEYNYRTGESTLGFGAGLKLEAGVFEAGVTEKFIFKFDKNNNFSDIGMEMEGGTEAHVGPVIIDRNVKGTLTMESGVQGSYTEMGTGNEVEVIP